MIPLSLTNTLNQSEVSKYWKTMENFGKLINDMNYHTAHRKADYTKCYVFYVVLECEYKDETERRKKQYV